jgi:RHS repeat-associated protein
VVYHYDLFGNLIGESNPDGTILREWVYVNGQRLAMILPAPGGGGGGCESPSAPNFPSCSSLAARPGAEAGGGAILLLLGPAFIAIGLKFHRRKYTIAGLTFIGGVLFLFLMPQAQSQTPAETIFYYHNDHLGTPRVLTDQTGVVVWDVDHTPFGDISSYVTNTLPVDQPFRFPGQYQDTMTGLYYNWNRYYIPETGRYNRVDDLVNNVSISDNRIHIGPFIINDNISVNKLYSYGYVANNPIIFTDVTGLFMLYICFITNTNPIPSNYGNDTSTCRGECKSSMLAGSCYCDCEVTGIYNCYPLWGDTFKGYIYYYHKHYDRLWLAQYKSPPCPTFFFTSR